LRAGCDTSLTHPVLLRVVGPDKEGYIFPSGNACSYSALQKKQGVSVLRVVDRSFRSGVSQKKVHDSQRLYLRLLNDRALHYQKVENTCILKLPTILRYC